LKFGGVDKRAIDCLGVLNLEKPPVFIIPKYSIAYLPGGFSFDLKSGGAGIARVFDLTKGTSGGTSQADGVCAREGKGFGIFINK
jgi:hypothetical protein